VYLRENWSDYISVKDPAEASDKIITQILSIPSNSDNTVKQQNFFTAIEKGTETVIDIALMIGVCKVARKAMVALERSPTRVIQGEKVVQLPHQSNKITQKTHKQQQQTINKTLEQIEKKQVETTSKFEYNYDNKINANDLHHIFENPIHEHHFDEFLKLFDGDQVKAFKEIYDATYKQLMNKGVCGDYKEIINICGFQIEVRGIILPEGTVKVGTAFLQKG